MPVNCVNATMNPAQRQAGHDQCQFQHRPFLIDLALKERLDIAKFGEKNRNFVIKALAIAEQNPRHPAALIQHE